MARRRTSAIVRTIVWVLAALAIAASLIPLIENNRWWVRIFIFPQVQLTALLILLAIAVPFLFKLRRTPPKLLLGALALCLAYQLHYLVPFTPLWPDEARTAGSCAPEDRLRVLVLNVKEGNEQAAPVLRLVGETEPDLFLAVETDAYWTGALAPLQRELPHVVAAPRDSPWGLTLYSRLPLASPEVRYVVEDYVPSIKTGVALRSGETVSFYGLHPKPPLMHGTAPGESEVERVGREIGASGRPAVLAGDLNDVPWGYALNNMLEASNMVDPRVGLGIDSTYQTGIPLMRWPLDHIFFTPHFALQRFDPLGDVGSDHLPLLADLCFAPAGTRQAESRSAGR